MKDYYQRYLEEEIHRLLACIEKLEAERDEYMWRSRQFQEDWHAAEARVQKLEAALREILENPLIGGGAA